MAVGRMAMWPAGLCIKPMLMNCIHVGTKLPTLARALPEPHTCLDAGRLDLPRRAKKYRKRWFEHRTFRVRYIEAIARSRQAPVR